MSLNNLTCRLVGIKKYYNNLKIGIGCEMMLSIVICYTWSLEFRNSYAFQDYLKIQRLTWLTLLLKKLESSCGHL